MSYYSGPCMTLELSKRDTSDGVVDGIRSTIGPPDVEKAKASKAETPERLECNAQLLLLLLAVLYCPMLHSYKNMLLN